MTDFETKKEYLKERYGEAWTEYVSRDPELFNWFANNLSSLAYFELIREPIEEEYLESLSDDIATLGMMAKVAYNHLGKADEMPEDEVFRNIHLDMGIIYEEQYDYLTEEAKRLYHIGLSRVLNETKQTLNNEDNKSLS